MRNKLMTTASGATTDAGGGRPTARGLHSLQRFRKRHIEQVLRTVSHDITEAALLLDISVVELREWMGKLDIPVGIRAPG